jgi:hypothetical protein
MVAWSENLLLRVALAGAAGSEKRLKKQLAADRGLKT